MKAVNHNPSLHFWMGFNEFSRRAHVSFPQVGKNGMDG
jgi:hypothetical protein